MEGDELFVPGRLCLLGEHSDWAGGYRGADPRIAPGRCLVAGTDQGLSARAAPREGALSIRSVFPDGGRPDPFVVEAHPATLARAARQDPIFGYAAGVAAEVLEGFGVAGLDLEITASSLPMGSGLSSSAALCVLVARALGRVWQLGLSAGQEMELAYAGERRTGSECGRMDQVCALGRGTNLLHFDGPELAIERVEPGAAIPLLIVDLRRGKDTKRILADLNACFPDTPGPLAARVRDALGPRNAALLDRATAALRAGDAPGLGVSMSEAQALFDSHVAPACAELAAPRLHEVLASAPARELAWGGKGVGSQGDGCAQLVARSPEQRETLGRRLEAEFGVKCLPLDLVPSSRPPGPPTRSRLRREGSY